MSSSSSAFLLRPCSSRTKSLPEPPRFGDGALDEEVVVENYEELGQHDCASVNTDGAKNKEESVDSSSLDRKGKWPGVPRSIGKSKDATLKNKKRRKGASSSCSCASTSSSSSFSKQQQRGVLLRCRKKNVFFNRGGDGRLQELALPLGMSFAAIVAEVVEKKDTMGEGNPPDHLLLMCISAVKEAVESVYEKRCEYFLRNFEMSFGSTLRTLLRINKENINGHKKLMGPSCNDSHFSTLSSYVDPGTQSSEVGPENRSLQVSPEIQFSGGCQTQTLQEGPLPHEQVEEIQSLNQENQIILLHGQASQQLPLISHNTAGHGFNQSILSTFERSVSEQARSNNLKEFQIGLTLKRMQLKKEQLDLSHQANALEKIKIHMGISKANFKEEKLKNQMQDVRHVELLRRCIDFLVAGLLIMSVFLAYGAWVFSYTRIKEATASCAPSTKETKSWWMPKQMVFLNSNWHTLRCHTVVLTRMSFGILMILSIAYSLFQRSSSSGSLMPVTFILLVLGIICGGAGKFCIDTLGGSGYWWLVHWEMLCLLHFFVSAYPSFACNVLYGPVLPVDKGVMFPYWIRRSIFYSTLLVILPLLSGLIPFASFGDWGDHFIGIAFPSREVEA